MVLLFVEDDYVFVYGMNSDFPSCDRLRNKFVLFNPMFNNILHEDDKTKLMCLSGVKQYPMRVKCATLSWHTLTSAINNSQEEINTERN